MQNTQEKQIVINRTKELDTFIDSVINENDKLNYLNTDKIQKLANINKHLLDKLEKDKIEIAIIGLEKAGKSTFANALIESNIFPSAAERCTYTTTRLMYGKDKANVTFYTIEEFNIRFIALLNTLQYPNINKITLETLSLEEFNRYFNELEEKNPNLYKLHKGKTEIEIQDILSNKHRLILTGETKTFLGDDIYSEEFKSYIKGESNDRSKPYSVKNIDIQSSKLTQLQNAIIYDVPGFDSTTQLHTEQTTERLKSADVIILITNVGQNPNIQGTVLNILKEQIDEDGLKLKEKLFIFGNKQDTANTLEQAEDNHNTLLRDIINLGIGSQETIRSGSALKYLTLKNIAGDQYKNNFQIDDNIDSFRNLIITYYQTERFELLKKKLSDTKQKLYNALQNELNIHHNDRLPLSEDDEKFRIKNEADKDLHQKFKAAISTIRNNLKSDIIGTDSKTNISLTKLLQARFDERCNFPYADEQKLENIIIQTDKSSSIELNEAINPYLRSSLSEEIRQNISDIIQDFFEEYGKNKENEIIEYLLSSLIRVHNDDIKRELIQFIQSVRTENIYSPEKYEYLFERFARNLFDIFSYSVGSNARIQKFNNAKKDFIYLDSYYCEDKEEDFKLISLLLTQSDKDERILQVIFEKIYKAIGDWIKNDTLYIDKARETVELVQQGWGFLKGKFNKEYTNEVLQEPTKKEVKTSKKLFDLVNAEDITKSIKQSKSKADIINEINADINNIQDIIRNAVIKAMNIETVFFNSFDKQLSLLDDSSEGDNLQYHRYRALINKIINVNHAQELSDIDKTIELNKRKQTLLEKVNSFLSN
ncbi:dynamin family protein [Actinobacillus lignieresii]|uniref:Predicted GTPase n=1 Tax=Actinobacillus lignieresii TaxID=720 RepID=A0A380TTY0_ACTLI|nr:dynamin family protein [Actinobacillus lignieresii]SUT91000.1 Predicted GTPase [Actinobacillus lignieresii]